jgi:hypothetical protein
MAEALAELYVALDSFVIEVDGLPVTIERGQVALRDDPIRRDHADQFEAMTIVLSQPELEQGLAAVRVIGTGQAAGVFRRQVILACCQRPG